MPLLAFFSKLPSWSYSVAPEFSSSDPSHLKSGMNFSFSQEQPSPHFPELSLIFSLDAALYSSFCLFPITFLISNTVIAIGQTLFPVLGDF